MELHTPDHYSRFRCLADRCPHTCCAWWEVPVDRASAAFYETLPGPLRDTLRTALTTDEDGEACLLLTGGKCPLLDEKGLCSLQLQYGESRIPAICREHPRFSYDYGAVREVGLCASCPECARLILSSDLTLTTDVLPGPERDTDPLLLPLLTARDAAFALLRADEPLPLRLRAVLLLGNDLQNALDGEEVVSLPRIAALYRDAFPTLEEVPLPPREEALTRVLEALKALEILQPQWADLLDSALARLSQGSSLPKPPDTEGARAAAYFLYRHWLRALNDGDLLTWCELAVLGTAAAGALAPLVEGGFPEAFRLFCLEVEHSQPNLDALQDALWQELALPQLLSLA